MLRGAHPPYRRRNVFEAAIHTKPGASGTHEPPSGGPHIGGAPATPIAALSGSTHKAPGSAGGYLLHWFQRTFSSTRRGSKHLLPVDISPRMPAWDDILLCPQHSMILTITLQPHSLLQLAMAAFLAGDGHGWRKIYTR